MRDLRAAHLRFDGARLSLARRLRGLTKSEVASRVGVTPAAISQYEHGHTRPRATTFASLSFALRVPPEFFARHASTPRLVEEDWHFRSLRATRKRDRDRVLARVALLADLVEFVERFVQLPHVDLPEDVPAQRDNEAIEALAVGLRDTWNLGMGPIGSMVRLLELRGTIAARITVDSQAVDAFSGHVGQRPYVVLTADKIDFERSRFDAAHELGHLVLHADVNAGSATAEREAHRFAAAFLLPRETILEEFPRRVHWPSLFDLKSRWGVSLSALLYRAQAIGLLAEPAYRRAMTELNARGWRRREPTEGMWMESPTLLRDALELVRRAHGMSEERVCDELGLADEDFNALVPREAEMLSLEGERRIRTDTVPIAESGS